MKTDKIMTASELLQTMDARVWAQEFIRIFKDRKEDIDEGLMIGWFANAIMCGSDHMYWNMDEAMGKLKAENEELKIEKINLNNRIACMIDDIHQPKCEYTELLKRGAFPKELVEDEIQNGIVYSPYIPMTIVKPMEKIKFDIYTRQIVKRERNLDNKLDDPFEWIKIKNK